MLREEQAMIARTIGPIVSSMLPLSASFVPAVILTILAAREIELPNKETDGGEAYARNGTTA